MLFTTFVMFGKKIKAISKAFIIFEANFRIM
jgi:hypothetical protein